VSVTPLVEDDVGRRLTTRPEAGDQVEDMRMENLRIDCDECVMRETNACDDCVVSFIVEREPGDAIVVDVAEQRALRALGDRGLVPRLRHRSRAG
jgi:hypothetical protein